VIARAGILIAAFALIVGLLGLAIAWPWLSVQPGFGLEGASSTSTGPSARRNEVLRHLTELYVARGENVSAGMRSGVELAPASFLNTELERQGAKWRVGNVRGPDVEFFDISK
jgi:hypothetical protein